MERTPPDEPDEQNADDADEQNEDDARREKSQGLSEPSGPGPESTEGA